MFLENEHQPIMSHSPYELTRPAMDHHHHIHHHQTVAADQQDDSEGRSTASSPTSSYRDLSGCEDFDLKIPKPTGGPGSTGNNNKEQKPKKHKCKHCGLECTEKVQYWKHIRTHIKPEQLLECPNCEFATDLKHHYEYHLLNHTGAKPFTCPDCDYKCVSKSMLQSHLKSHSNVFQFQCYDCGYASKYMHSLKQHLKKRDHRPATPLNPDGTPNPDIVIDVVGNRRGPRQNKKHNRHNPYQQHQPTVIHAEDSHPSPYSMQQLLQIPTTGAPVQYPIPESFMYSMITKRTMEMVDYHAEYMAIKNNNNTTAVDDKMDVQCPTELAKVEMARSSGDRTPEPITDLPVQMMTALDMQGPLNLSKDSMTPRVAGSSRRKGIACKLERPEPPKVIMSVESKSEEQQEPMSPVMEREKSEPIADKEDGTHVCHHCDIIFKESIMYSMHMGFHSFRDPFACNLCGEITADKFSFFAHIARVPHS
ncbi:protein hunchback [Daktulosphaira vitifoliae]|uniref:protein hunchback n=1 Tax=Daktulosphaira vitifoliae TaxID=58002 RepID=UPI0021AAF173|nr:protein hunchback [Daktulosphaira vitifoliae]